MAIVRTGPNLPRGLVEGPRRFLPPVVADSSGPGNGNLPTRVVRPGGPTNLPPASNQPITSAATRGGVVSSAAGAGNGTGAVDPTYRPPVAPPPANDTRPPVAPPPPVRPRTFQDPQRPSDDPRIAELLRALTGDKASNEANRIRSAELEKLIQQFMRGEGIQTGDMSNDPAAQAYAVAKQREAERMREAAAAQVGASGVDGSSELATRAAQIREAVGTDIASNNAELTNKRRAEALATAMSGANLQLTELQRRQMEQQAASGDRLALLNVLINKDKGEKDSYEREKDRIAAERAREVAFQREQQEKRYQEARQREMDRIREEQARLELERKKREAEREKGPSGPWRGGIRF